MGFGFDGDADRMLAVDGRGRVVDGDHVLFLWGSVLQEQRQLPDQRLVATVMSNLGFERAWQARGGRSGSDSGRRPACACRDGPHGGSPWRRAIRSHPVFRPWFGR
jgi:hypothetical protein